VARGGVQESPSRGLGGNGGVLIEVLVEDGVLDPKLKEDTMRAVITEA